MKRQRHMLYPSQRCLRDEEPAVYLMSARRRKERKIKLTQMYEFKLIQMYLTPLQTQTLSWCEILWLLPLLVPGEAGGGHILSYIESMKILVVSDAESY